jgi:hypothetical protein
MHRRNSKPNGTRSLSAKEPFAKRSKAMDNESTAKSESLSPEEGQAKAAILAECVNLAAAGVTFVAVHFDGYGESGTTEEVKCFDSEFYAYEEHKLVAHDAAYLQYYFEALVPFGL